MDRDDSFITQDQYDRDGEGSKWQPDVNVDLRAAFKPLIMYGIKWDLGAGDRLKFRASTDFDSSQKNWWRRNLDCNQDLRKFM